MCLLKIWVYFILFTFTDKKNEHILLSRYHFHCNSCPLYFSQGVVPAAPEQPTDEVENQVKSPDPRPDAPPDYNSHLVLGGLNNQKDYFHLSKKPY